MQHQPGTIVVATDAQKTSPIFVKRGTNGFLVAIPELENNGTDEVRMEIYTGSELPQSDKADLAKLQANVNDDWVVVDALLCVGGEKISAVPAQWGGLGWIRFVVNVAQTSARTFKVIEI
jgi:hypothetical protein